MRHIINLLILFFLFTNCNFKKNIENSTKNDLEYNLLFGNVKSVSTKFANDGYTRINKRNLKIFNKSKRLIKEIDYVKDSIIIKQSDYEFNKNGQLIKSIKLEKYSKSKQICKYRYNNNDSLISITCNKKNFNTDTKIKRDFKNRIKKIEHFINDSLDYSLIYKRNLITGQKDSEIFSSKSTWKETKYKYENNLVQNKVEKEVWIFAEEKHTMSKQFYFKYNQNREIKSKETRNLWSSSYKVDNLKYYDNGVLAEQSIQLIKDSTKTHNLLIKWDRFGNVILHQDYKVNGDISKSRKIVYEYDKLNNWISKKNLKNKSLHGVSKRTIEYYK